MPRPMSESTRDRRRPRRSPSRSSIESLRCERDVRYLILSDIHANIDALEVVLGAAENWEKVLVLGDLVGYGGAPNAVIDRVRALDPVAVIRGNHDKAACGLDDGSNFNQVARFAAAWTNQQLTSDNREYLRQLPQGPIAI